MLGEMQLCGLKFVSQVLHEGRSDDTFLMGRVAQ